MKVGLRPAVGFIRSHFYHRLCQFTKVNEFFSGVLDPELLCDVQSSGVQVNLSQRQCGCWRLGYLCGTEGSCIYKPQLFVLLLWKYPAQLGLRFTQRPPTGHAPSSNKLKLMDQAKVKKEKHESSWKSFCHRAPSSCSWSWVSGQGTSLRNV